MTFFSGCDILPENGTSATDISVKSITLNENSSSLVVGKTYQLNPTVFPENASNKNITWTSSDETKATVNKDGLVTGISSGTVYITALTKDGNFTDTIEMTIELYAGVTDLEIWECSYSIKQYHYGYMEIDFSPDNASDISFTYLFSNDNLEIYENSYFDELIFFGKKTGSTEITITSVDNPDVFKTVTITVEADNDKPQIDNCYLIDSQTIYLDFTENMDESTLLNISNYTIIKDPAGTKESVIINSITNLKEEDFSNSEILLNLQSPLILYDEITVTADNLTDKSGNVIYGESFKHGFIPPISSVIDISCILENNGKIKLAPGAIPGLESTNYIPDEIYVLLFYSGETPYRSINKAQYSINSDGSTSEYFPENYSLYNEEYDLYIYAFYDMDGNTATTDDWYSDISDPVQYTVTSGED
jgi:hypothetical protein